MDYTIIHGLIDLYNLIIMDYKPKIKIIHICLSTSKATTSEKFLIYNPQIIIQGLYNNLWIKRSLKPYRVLCETKDHLHRNVTPIFFSIQRVKSGNIFLLY